MSLHIRSKPEDRKTKLRKIVTGSAAGQTVEYVPHPTASTPTTSDDSANRNAAQKHPKKASE